MNDLPPNVANLVSTIQDLGTSVVPFLGILSAQAPNFVGILLPPIIQVINKDIPQEREKERFWASVVICFAVAILLKWNDLLYGSPESVLTSAGIIFAESQIVFKTYFKDSWLQDKIKERFPGGSEPKVGGEVAAIEQPVIPANIPTVEIPSTDTSNEPIG